jgi:hypothetical protein
VFEDGIVDCCLDTAGVSKGRMTSILQDDCELRITEVSNVCRRLPEAGTEQTNIVAFVRYSVDRSARLGLLDKELNDGKSIAVHIAVTTQQCDSV